MFRKILSVETEIVYRREESINLFEGKKKLDKVVSGRVSKEQIKLFGYVIRTKYTYQICLPQIDDDNAYEVGALFRIKGFVENECRNKVLEYSSKK